MIDPNAPSTSVIEAIAVAEGIDPVALTPPLYAAIDPEALDAIVDSADCDLSIEFSYQGYTIQVDGSGDVTIADAPSRKSVEPVASD